MLNKINFSWLLTFLIIGLIYGNLINKVNTVIKYDKLSGKLVYEDKDENDKKCYKYY